MKLKTCFLVVRVFDTKKLHSLVEEAKEVILQNGGKQKILTDPKQALTTTDPYTEREFQEDPSYVIKNCLVSLRLWYSVFDGPAVSFIMVGRPKNVSQLKDLLTPLCSQCFYRGRSYDDREKFTVSDNAFDCPKDLDWLNKYFYAEVLVKDLKEGTLQLESYSGLTLWDEVKELVVIGERLSGDPEILHEIEDVMIRGEGSVANRAQIQKVLESVPHIFSEEWVSPEDYNGLAPAQKIIYTQLANSGIRLTGPEIQKIIETAIQYKFRHRTKSLTE